MATFRKRSVVAKANAVGSFEAGDKPPARIAAGLGSRIREAREAFRLTQAAFAERAGIARSYLSEVEAGKSKPSTEIAAALLDLHPLLSLRYIFFGVGDLFRLERDLIDIIDPFALEAMLLRAEREQAMVPPVLGARDLSNPAFRKWLARNLFEQIDLLGGAFAGAVLRAPISAEGIAASMDHVEAALQAARSADDVAPVGSVTAKRARGGRAAARSKRSTKK